MTAIFRSGIERTYAARERLDEVCAALSEYSCATVVRTGDIATTASLTGTVDVRPNGPAGCVNGNYDKPSFRFLNAGLTRWLAHLHPFRQKPTRRSK